MNVYTTGCPLCGEDNTTFTLYAQMGHMYGHSWWQRLKLRRRTRQALPDLLFVRKYAHLLDRWGES